MSLLDVEHLSSYYGKFLAVDDVSLHVDEGECVALIGSNGAGKSTILKTIAGLVHPRTGVVRLNGSEIQRRSAHSVARMGITYIPESRSIFGTMSVKDNLELGGYLHRRRKKELLERVFAIFPALLELLERPAASLSGGERQQLSMGMGLMADPLVYLIDEPSLGLSPVVAEALFQTIRKMNEETKATVLLVEQDAGQALSISSRAYVVEAHRIRLEGKSAVLAAGDEVRRTYLGVI